jgi:hypothetical protein
MRKPTDAVRDRAEEAGLGAHVRSGRVDGMQPSSVLALTLTGAALGVAGAVASLLLMPVLMLAAVPLAAGPPLAHWWWSRRPRHYLHCFERGVVHVRRHRGAERIRSYRWHEVQLSVSRGTLDHGAVPPQPEAVSARLVVTGGESIRLGSSPLMHTVHRLKHPAAGQ